MSAHFGKPDPGSIIIISVFFSLVPERWEEEPKDGEDAAFSAASHDGVQGFSSSFRGSWW